MDPLGEDRTSPLRPRSSRRWRGEWTEGTSASLPLDAGHHDAAHEVAPEEEEDQHDRNRHEDRAGEQKVIERLRVLAGRDRKVTQAARERKFRRIVQDDEWEEK